MITGLYQYLLGRRLGSHSETQYIITTVPAETTYKFEIYPAKGTYCIIIRRFSYGNIVPNMFQFEGAVLDRKGGGMTWHSGILDSETIRYGIDTWLYVYEDSPLYFWLTNLDDIAHFWQSWLWHIDVGTKELLEQIEKEIEESGLPAEAIAARLMAQFREARIVRL